MYDDFINIVNEHKKNNKTAITNDIANKTHTNINNITNNFINVINKPKENKIFNDALGVNNPLNNPQNNTQNNTQNKVQNNSSEFSCMFCNKSYSSYQSLWNHNKTYHVIEKKIARQYKDLFIIVINVMVNLLINIHYNRIIN